MEFLCVLAGGLYKDALILTNIRIEICLMDKKICTKEKSKNKTNHPSQIFRITFKLSQRAIQLTEKIVFVIDHVRVMVLMVFAVKMSMSLFDDLELVEFLESF